MVLPQLSVTIQNKYFLRQVLLSSAAFAHGVNSGGVTGFSSVLLSQLQQSRSIVLTTDETSWLASVPTIIMVPVSVCNCWALKYCGRKKVEIVCDILNVTSWMIMHFATSYEWLMVGRLIHGVYMATAYPMLLAYLGEICSPQYRSTFLSLVPLGNMLGVLIVQLLGEYIDWRILTIIFASSSAYNMIAIYFSSESYVTYLDSNRFLEARNSFQFYRGDSVTSQTDFDIILKSLQKQESTKGVLKKYATKSFIVPFAITTLVYVTSEATATQAVSFYSEQIVSVFSTDATFQYYTILSLNVLRICAVITSPVLVTNSSVRKVLLVSGFMLGCSLLLMAAFMYLVTVYPSNRIYPIIAIALLITNAMFFAIGLGPLPSVVCGEMFPPITRAVGCAWSIAISFLCLFFVVKFIPASMAGIGLHWTFCLCGVCTLIGISICCFVVPNTNNKTLEEINDLYRSNIDETVC